MRLAFVATMLAVATAHAQPASTLEEERPAWRERFNAGLGIHIANSESTWLHLAFTGEGGVRAPGVPSPFAVRGRGFFSIAGTTEQSDWSGKYHLIGAGIEVLACIPGEWLCAVGGLDAGYESADLYDGNSGRFEGARSGPFVGPRWGIEAGFSRVRFRFIVDRYRWKTHHDPSEWMANGGVTFSGTARF